MALPPDDRGKLLPNTTKERMAKNSDTKRSGEQRHGFEAFSSFPLPVYVPEIEPQGEFIQGERGAHSVGHADGPRDPHVRSCRASADLEEPSVANHQEQKDAPHQVMDVPAVHRDIVKRPDIIVNGKGDCTHDQGRGEESDRCQEKPFPRRLGQPTLVNPMEESARERGGDHRKNDSDGERRDPEGFVGPRHGTGTLSRYAGTSFLMHDSYSERSASTGLIDAARRAGT